MRVRNLVLATATLACLAACAHRPRNLPLLPGPLVLLMDQPFTRPDGDGQVSRHILQVPAFSNDTVILNLGVEHGADASGKRGLKVAIHSPHGALLLEERITEPGWWLRDLPIHEGGAYVLRLVDIDGLVANAAAAQRGKVQAKVFP